MKVILRNFLTVIIILLTTNIFSQQSSVQIISHVTKSGESLSSIAEIYHVTVANIISNSSKEVLFFNDISEEYQNKIIRSGIELQIRANIKNISTSINSNTTAPKINTSSGNSKALSVIELERLIDRVKKICKGPSVFHDGHRYHDSYYNYLSYKYPVIFYTSEQSKYVQLNGENYGFNYTTVIEGGEHPNNSPLIELFLARNQWLELYQKEYIQIEFTSERSKKENFDFYTFNAYQNHFSKNRKSKIDIDDDTKDIIEKLYLRLNDCYKELANFNVQSKYKNWQLSEDETSLNNKLGFIPLTQTNYSKKESRVKSKSGIKYTADRELYLALPTEHKECEITFDVVYTKMFSTKDENTIGFKLNNKKKYTETKRKKEKYFPYTTTRRNPSTHTWKKVTDYSRPEYRETTQSYERTRDISCGYSRIILHMDKNSTVQKIKIVLTNSNSEIYINGVLMSSNDVDLVSANELRIFGNKVGIKNVKFRPIQSTSTIKEIEEEIKTIHSFFNDLDKALRLGESFRDYNKMVNSNNTSLGNRNYKINSFVKKYPEFPEYLEMPYIKNTFADVKDSKSLDIIMTSNDNKNDKYNKIKDLRTSNSENRDKKNELIIQLKSEIRNDIQNKIDSICENTSDNNNTIDELVNYYNSMDELDIECGGEYEIKKGISLQIENESLKITNKKASLTNKIIKLNSYLESLDNLSKSTSGYRKGQKGLKNLMNQTISTTANMYYKTAEKIHPLHITKEIVKETAIFERDRYVEYTYITGGDTYTSVIAYEMKGTIKNISQSTIKIKVNSYGSIKRSSSGIDIGGWLHDRGVKLDAYKFGKDYKEYTIAPGKTVNYRLSGNCTGSVNMKVHFKVIEVGRISIDD